MNVLREEMKWGDVSVVELEVDGYGEYVFRFISETRDDVSCEVIGDLDNVKGRLFKERDGDTAMFFAMTSSSVSETDEGVYFSSIYTPQILMEKSFEGSGHELETLFKDETFAMYFNRCASAANGRYGRSLKYDNPHHADAVIYLNCSLQVTDAEDEAGEDKAEDFDVEPVEGPYIEVDPTDMEDTEPMFNYPGVCQTYKK